MDFYFGYSKGTSEKVAGYFNDYVKLIFDYLKEDTNFSVVPGDLLLYKKVDAYDYKTVFANEFEISFIQSMMQSIKENRNVVYSEYVNLYSINHLADLISARYLQDLSEKVNLIPENKRKFFVSKDILVCPETVNEDGEELSLNAKEEISSKIKYRNKNVLMFELLPKFVEENKLKDLPIELVMMKYLKAIKELGV